LILGFPEGLLKLPFEELRLNPLLFRALPEVGLSSRRFPPEELVGTSQISGPMSARRRRLVRNDPAERGIYFQARAAAGANQFHGRRLLLAHYGLKLRSRENRGARGVKG